MLARPPSPTAPPTMADLARHLGLARSTVSMALRHHPEIAPATRARVLAAATALGYRANPLVTALMTDLRRGRRPRTTLPLALVLENPAGGPLLAPSLLRPALAGLTERAHTHGYHLEPFHLGVGGLPPARLADVLTARGIGGAVLAPLPSPAPSRFVAPAGFATVTIGWSIADHPGHRASCDHFRNLLLAWDTLARRGYRRIGLATTLPARDGGGLAYLGAFLARNATRPTAARVAPLTVDCADAASVPLFRDWLARERPDAVLVAEADSFVPLAREAAAGLAPMALAALELSVAPPGTAGIDDQTPRVAAAAIDLLVNQLLHPRADPPAAPTVLHLAGLWRDGATVPLAAPDRDTTATLLPCAAAP